MFKTSHAVDILATPEAAWAMVKDVARWRQWFLGVELVQLHGGFAPGAQGLLYLDDGKVYRLSIEKFLPGLMDMHVGLAYKAKMHLQISVAPTPEGCRIRLEGELLGVGAILHTFGWGKNLRTGLVPTTRRLGILSQGEH